MSLNIGDFIQYQRWDEFHFYENSLALSTGINTNIALSTLWRLVELRVHFSVAVVSETTLVARISSIKDSSLNNRLLSQALLGVQDLILQYDTNPLLLFSDDQIIISASATTLNNITGIEAIGWAVRG